MKIILLLAAIFLLGVYGAVLKPAMKRCKSTAEIILFNGLFCFIAVIFSFFTVAGNTLTLPVGGYIWALIYGVLFLMTVFLNMKAIETGPLSITSIFYNFSLILPLIYSFCFLGEKITLLRAAGIFLLSICLVLFANPGIADDKPITAKWFITALFAMLSNGILTVIVKAYQIRTNGEYTSPFVLFGYLFSALFSFILFLVLHNNKLRLNNKKNNFSTLPMAVIIIITALSSFGGNYIVTYLAPVMDGAIVYPSVQGGAPALTVIFSFLFFKENINKKKAFATFLGIVSVILLTL